MAIDKIDIVDDPRVLKLSADLNGRTYGKPRLSTTDAVTHEIKTVVFFVSLTFRRLPPRQTKRRTSCDYFSGQFFYYNYACLSQ